MKYRIFKKHYDYIFEYYDELIKSLIICRFGKHVPVDDIMPTYWNSLLIDASYDFGEISGGYKRFQRFIERKYSQYYIQFKDLLFDDTPETIPDEMNAKDLSDPWYVKEYILKYRTDFDEDMRYLIYHN